LPISILFPDLPVDFEDLPTRYQIDLPASASLIEAAPAEVSVSVAETVEESSSVEQVAAPAGLEASPMEPMPTVEARKSSESLTETMPDLNQGLDLKSYLVEMEVQLIQRALAQTEGNVSQAAKLLQTNRTTLVEKIRKYDLS
jgi:sigma-54 specific flagellar transcriptional regulator A